MEYIEPTYIDVFAGCGGLSTGLLNAGWKGVFAVENNKDAFSTFRDNLIINKSSFNWPSWLPMQNYDINELIKNYSEELRNLQGTILMVAGGPPCQGFSMAGKRNTDDKRNKLVKSYIRFIKLIMPEIILFENVNGFTIDFKNKVGTKKYSLYIERALRRLGYKTKYKIVDMSEYGIPQKRKRFILVAMRNGDPENVFRVLDVNRKAFCKSHGIDVCTSIYEAIGDLERVYGEINSPDSKGFNAGIYGPVSSGYQKLMRQGIINNKLVDSHRFVNHRKKTIELHNELLDKAPRGKRLTPNNTYGFSINRRGVTVLDKNAQSPTITSIPDELIHYSEPRILTVREHARLQGFPDWFEFKGKYTSGGKQRKNEVPRYTQVGNAVPPLFAEQIGSALLTVIKKNE